jgi:gamma-glutamyltranspeptidase/glutathione hydrolase
MDRSKEIMRIRRTLTIAAALLVAAQLQGYSEGETARETQPEAPAASTSGMVSSAHPLATEAGLDVLAAGGNAFDAAVAVAVALNVVEPMMSGAGGYGTIMVYHRETGRARFLNSSDRIPRSVDADVYRAPTPGWEENRRGAKAVSTPANVRAWEAMSSEYGALRWADLFGPAVRLAREGFELGEETTALLGRAFEEFPDHAKAFYGTGGRALRAGERLIQTDLAASLERIAGEGAGSCTAARSARRSPRRCGRAEDSSRSTTSRRRRPSGTSRSGSTTAACEC